MPAHFLFVLPPKDTTFEPWHLASSSFWCIKVSYANNGKKVTANWPKHSVALNCLWYFHGFICPGDRTSLLLLLTAWLTRQNGLSLTKKLLLRDLRQTKRIIQKKKKSRRKFTGGNIYRLSGLNLNCAFLSYSVGSSQSVFCINLIVPAAFCFLKRVHV